MGRTPISEKNRNKLTKSIRKDYDLAIKTKTYNEVIELLCDKYFYGKSTIRYYLGLSRKKKYKKPVKVLSNEISDLLDQEMPISKIIKKLKISLSYFYFLCNRYNIIYADEKAKCPVCADKQTEVNKYKAGLCGYCLERNYNPKNKRK